MTVLAHHLIWTGYGHWLPNDPRGSGSYAVSSEELQGLGEVHFGRKSVQPPRSEVERFYGRADERLKYPRLLFDESQRSVIGDAFGETIRGRGYTCYACAVLLNHVHLVIRAHRDDAETMIDELQRESRLALYRHDPTLIDHPIWTEKGRKVFLDTINAIRVRIRYVERNPEKDGLPAQQWPFMKTYDGWPYSR
jgi:REP element-mobilizing transposase RayT